MNNTSKYNVYRIYNVEEIQSEWMKLLDKIPYHTIFQHYEWNKYWIDHFMDSNTELYFLVCYSQMEIVAIAPFVRNRLELFDNSIIYKIGLIREESYEYLDIIADPNHLEASVECILNWLMTNLHEWDIICLTNIIEDSLTYKYFKDAFTKYDLFSSTDYNRCFKIDLNLSFEEYISGLDGYMKDQLQYYLDQIENECKYYVKKIKLDELDGSIGNRDKVVNLMEHSNALYSEKVKNLIGIISKKFRDKLILWCLYDEENIVAAEYSFEYNETRSICLVGETNFFEGYSTPNTVLVLYIIKDSINKGFKGIDIFSGFDQHKYIHFNKYHYTSSTNLWKRESDYINYYNKQRDYKNRVMAYEVLEKLRATTYDNVQAMQFLDRKMRILFIAPHFDDDIIGCGGIMARHYERGDETTVLFVTNGNASPNAGCRPEELSQIRRGEAIEALNTIGCSRIIFLNREDGLLTSNSTVISEISNIIKLSDFDSIYLTHPQDLHPDHRAVSKILYQALRTVEFHGNLYFYEVVVPLHNPNRYFDMSSEIVMMKHEALKKHRTQIKDLDYLIISKKINKYRGNSVGIEYCEAFRYISLSDLNNIFNVDMDVRRNM